MNLTLEILKKQRHITCDIFKLSVHQRTITYSFDSYKELSYVSDRNAASILFCLIDKSISTIT